MNDDERFTVESNDTHERVVVPEHVRPVLSAVVRLRDAGDKAYFKWTCVVCGSRQTFEEEGTLHLNGRCEECGHVTNMFDPRAGLNFLAVRAVRGNASEEEASLLDGMHRVDAMRRNES